MHPSSTTAVRMVTLSMLLTLISCGAPQRTSSDTLAMVSPQQFGRAMEIVRDTQSYVAWDEIGTCFARSMWLSALLAAEGIPSSAYMVTPRAGYVLRGPNGVEWNYHVAVMIRATDSSEQMILDPAISEQPIVDQKWLSIINGQSARIDIAPGSVVAHRMGPGNEVQGVNVISRMAEMPKFREEDIEKACGTIEIFQAELHGASYEGIKTKLHDEMRRVSQSLQSSGLLNFGVLTPGSIYCGRNKL